MKQYLFSSLLFALAFLSINNLNAQTIDCTLLSQWSSSSVYSNPGNRVVYLGVVYHNNFWTQNQTPSTNNGNTSQPWTIEGNCTSGTDGGTTTPTGGSWNLQGNTVSTDQFLGTINSQALVLKANNLESLIVNPEKGSVTIGRAQYPYYYKFEVNGGLSALFGPNQVNQNNLLTLYSGNQSTAAYTQGYRHYIGFSHGLFPNGEEYGIMNTYQYNAVSAVGVGKHLLIQNTNEGNLGVGIYPNAPSHKLSVMGSAAIDGSDLVLGRYDGRAQGSLTNNRALVHDNAGDDALVINYNGDFEGGVKIAGKGLAIGVNVIPNGYLVAVNGKIRARGVRCDTDTWADDVFDDNYKLMSMDSLKSYIEQNNHLPGIPTTAEVLKEGVDMTTINEQLLRKVEENTLYLLQLKAENEALKKEIEEIKRLLKK